MDTNINIISYLIEEKGFKQKEIAEKLKIKDAQISKWKLGVKIPDDREIELMKLADLWWEREDNYRPNAKWAVLVKSKNNENEWFDFFNKIFKSVFIHSPIERYSVAEKLHTINALTENFLIIFNQAGIIIPPEPPTRRFGPYDDLHIDPWEEFAYTYVENYLLLESWCCQNLNLKFSYMQEFFYLLPRYTILKLTIEENSNLFSQVPNPYDLHEYQRFIKEQVWEIENTIKDAVRHEGIDFDENIFDDLISSPKEKSMNMTTDNEFDELIGEVDSSTVEDIDQYLSYGERKIMQGIKENRKLLNKVLIRLEKL